jgi:cholesterol transport system auxiliary component
MRIISNIKTMRIVNIATIGLIAISQTACISLFPKPGKPPLIARFSAADNVRVKSPTDISIIVGTPEMPSGFASTDIAIIMKDNSIAYIDGVSLINPAPKAIQSLLIETFEKSGAFKLVTREETSVRAKYFLALEVSRFDISAPKYRQTGQANITISARLIDYRDRSPIAGKIFTSVAPAAKGSVIKPAMALELATQNAANEIMDWILAQPIK